MSLTADQVVARYTNEIWNEGKVELIRELCADPVTRHEAGKVILVSHDEQIGRIMAVRGALQPFFEVVIQTGDGTYSTLVFQCHTRPWTADGGEAPDTDWISENFKDNSAGKSACGIEVFKVIEGRISEVWNVPTMNGTWG